LKEYGRPANGRPPHCFKDILQMLPAEYERLRTFALDIAAALLPNGRWRDEGPERRFLGQGGLFVNRRSGAWYSNAAGKGGYCPIRLIEFLRNCSRTDAEQWARAWLANHPGTGECTGAADRDDVTSASNGAAEQVLAEAVEIAGTPAEAYLQSRRIDQPYPDGVRYWPNARPGEGAIVFELTAHGRVVGVQVGYLDPDGNESIVVPQRRKLLLEKAPGAVFEIPASEPGSETIIACGIEDALAIKRWLKRTTPLHVIGLPGDGALRHVRIERGATVTVCRDGDPPGSPADKAIQTGLDNLLLQAGYAPDWATVPNEVSVFVTRTPEGSDANSVLIDSKLGPYR